MRLVEKLAEYDVAWLEEPSRHDYEGLKTDSPRRFQLQVEKNMGLVVQGFIRL